MVPLAGTDSQTTGSLPPQLPPDRTDSRQRVIQLGAESPAHGGSFGAAQTGSDIPPPPCAVLTGAAGHVPATVTNTRQMSPLNMSEPS